MLSRVSSGPIGEPLKAAAFSIRAGLTPSASMRWPWVMVWPMTLVVKKPGASLTTMGFWPAILVISATACSMTLRSATASPTPILSVILVIFGICMTFW